MVGSHDHKKKKNEISNFQILILALLFASYTDIQMLSADVFVGSGEQLGG